MAHHELPEDTPIVNVAWIAARLGITPGRVRRYISENGPLPRLKVDVIGLREYAFTRATAEAWIEAYRAAPKLGRRANGSVRFWRRREETIRRLAEEMDELKRQQGIAEQSGDGKEYDRLTELLREADRNLGYLMSKRK